MPWIPRPDIFLAMVFIVSPLILIIAGMVSERIFWRNPTVTHEPLIPYCTGFLATFIACNLIQAESYMTHYVPYLEPGFSSRMAFVTGALIFIFPVVVIVSGIFAGFSFAGAWLMHRKTGLPESRE